MMMMLMMRLSMFLSACVSMGLSSYVYEKKYGQDCRMIVPLELNSIEFVPQNSTETTVLWKYGDPEPSTNARWKMQLFHYTIYKVTQRDRGQYMIKNKDGTIFSTNTLEVEANTKKLRRISGDSFNFTFSLEPDSCNINFLPENVNYLVHIVRRGVLLQDSGNSGCSGLKLLKPCGISNAAAQMSCAGRFEVLDDNGDSALMVVVEMKPSNFNYAALYAGIGSLVCTILGCCLKYCCCCGKSSSKKDSTESDAGSEAAAADAPAPDNNHGPPVYYHKYDHEPVGPRANEPTEPSETPCPTQPSHAVTDPLIHNPPTELPPPYSAASALMEQTEVPTFSLSSDQEPHFEIKGMKPYSDTDHTDVYTSHKLNFLSRT